MATATSTSARLDALVGAAAGSGGPGAAVAVTHADGVLYEGCFGLADVEWRQPVTPDTAFALGSVTKPVTALAVTLTARAGMLDLDSTVAEHLPHVSGPGASATMRQLLTHTSGSRTSSRCRASRSGSSRWCARPTTCWPPSPPSRSTSRRAPAGPTRTPGTGCSTSSCRG